MPVDIGSLEFYAGPTEVGGPDDLLAAIVDFIDGAREQLSIAVQELESEPIARAIVRARQRGVSVRVVLEGDYLHSYPAADDPFSPGGRNETNRELLTALLRADVRVITDLNPKIFHQKFVVSDPESTRAAVLSGSTNFTPTGIGANLNHVVILRGKRPARVFQEEFEELWSGTFGTKRERHDPAPKEYDVAGVRTKILFAPDHAPEMEVMKQMMKARERIDFAIFTFAQSSGIDDAMIAMQRAGISVRGILDRRQGNQTWAATRGLIEAGAQVHLSASGGGVGKLHHKLMVIDRQLVISGSFNYTGPATAFNDENIVVIGNLHESDPDAIARQRQIAEYALAEIDRIQAVHAGPALTP